MKLDVTIWKVEIWELGQCFWLDVIVTGMHTLAFCVFCTRMKKDAADAIQNSANTSSHRLSFNSKAFVYQITFFPISWHPRWSSGLDSWLSPRRPGFNSRSGNFVKHDLIERRSWHCYKSAWVCDFFGQTFFAISIDFQRVSVSYWTGIFIKTYFIYLSHSLTSITLR